MSDQPDIVTTLRRESFYRPTSRINSDGKAQIGFELMSINLQAADEIERLREQLRLANIDNFNTAAEVERLRAERDEARRSVCELSIQLGGVYRRIGGKTVEVTTPEGCAEIMRWDCYKENTDA